MKIRHINIEYFRGIRTLNWVVPETNIICLIGRGDTTKSTVLDAIRYALFPAWNPSFGEFDFFQANTNSNIEITLTLGELPEEFLSDAKYGLYLRGWDSSEKRIIDEQKDGLEDAISVKLTVDQNLEPKWTVICDRFEEVKTFSINDRIKACATDIGTYADKHLTWSKNSALSRITKSENISALLSGVSRAARDTLNDNRETKLADFDAAAATAESIAKSFGVPVSGEKAYKAQLDTGAVNIRMGGLSLHDQNIPLRYLGLGSRRMLTIGIQQQGLNEPHITLIDEIEIGLEPHRIARLLKKLSEDTTGQYFITTHSPVVLRELTVDQLSVVQRENHTISITCTAISAIKDNIQGKMRTGAEAFLAKKVIVCEGATEVGLCRGLDNNWISDGSDPFSFHGVAMFDARGGSNIKSTAEAIKSLGYDVFVIGDSDADDGFSDADATVLTSANITVLRWEGNVSIEEYFFKHLSWEAVKKSIDVAISMHGDGVLHQIQNQQGGLGDDPNLWTDSNSLREAIGRASLGNSNGKNSWFKRQDRAEEWILEIREFLNDSHTTLGSHIKNIKTWVIDANPS